MVTSSISGSSISATHQRPKPEDIFEKMDTDGSGGVSKEEFESAFVQISQKGGKAADGATSTDDSTSALKSKADAIYAKMETDGDGSLSASEFQTAAKAQEAQHAERGHGGHRGTGGAGASGPSSSAQKAYDPADTNKDGVVSSQEAAVYKTQQAAQQAQEAVKTYTDVQATASE